MTSTSTPWSRAELQRLVAGSAIFGAVGTLLVVWGLTVLRVQWFYWILGLLCVGAVWGDAAGAVRRAAVESTPADRRVSLAALAFQLTLAGAIGGSAAAFVPAAGGAALVVGGVLSLAWAGAALRSARSHGFVRDDFPQGTVTYLGNRLRHLARGMPTKDADPIGCALSLTSLVALGWLAFIVWLAVDVAAPFVGRVVFAGPRRLALRLVQPGSSFSMVLVAAFSWAIGFSVVAMGAYLIAGMTR